MDSNSIYFSNTLWNDGVEGDPEFGTIEVTQTPDFVKVAILPDKQASNYVVNQITGEGVVEYTSGFDFDYSAKLVRYGTGAVEGVLTGNVHSYSGYPDTASAHIIFPNVAVNSEQMYVEIVMYRDGMLYKEEHRIGTKQLWFTR